MKYDSTWYWIFFGCMIVGIIDGLLKTKNSKKSFKDDDGFIFIKL